MKYGFIKAASGSPELAVADCEFNTDKIIEMMKAAWDEGTEFICFPELCITGYTCGDLFFQKALLKKAELCLKKIAESTKDICLTAVVGLPFAAFGSLYDCAAVVSGGKILGLIPKKNIPNHGDHYEKRYFSPAFDGIKEAELMGESVPFGTDLLFRHENDPDFCFAVEICDDLCTVKSPSDDHALAGALLIANLAAVPETVGKSDHCRSFVAVQSSKLICAYVYANAGKGESTTDSVFSGHDIIAENGKVLNESELFKEGFICADIDLEMISQERIKRTTFMSCGNENYRVIPFSSECGKETFTKNIPRMPFVPEKADEREKRCRDILNIQSAGLYKRIRHTGCKNPVIGISGGLDSTLALLVTAKAMDDIGYPRENIIAVTMPCFGTTKRTKSNAQLLCECLGATFREVNISDAVNIHFRDIEQDPEKLDVTFENSQARERTQVLMDIANKLGGMVIGTGDLSELALGWATYNGDHMSMYGVNSSVPKTLIRYIVKYFADTAVDEKLKKVLYDILDTPVSPELLPAKDGEISQKTEDIVGPYELHDFFLYYFIRFGFSPDKIRFLANRAFSGIYESDVIDKWLKNFIRRFFSQQFKRSCVPDGPKVGSVALSPRGDLRMPSDASNALWMSEL